MKLFFDIYIQISISTTLIICQKTAKNEVLILSRFQKKPLKSSGQAKP